MPVNRSFSLHSITPILVPVGHSLGSFPSRCDCKEREYEGNGMSDRTEQITSACF